MAQIPPESRSHLEGEDVSCDPPTNPTLPLAYKGAIVHRHFRSRQNSFCFNDNVLMGPLLGVRGEANQANRIGSEVNGGLSDPPDERITTFHSASERQRMEQN